MIDETGVCVRAVYDRIKAGGCTANRGEAVTESMKYEIKPAADRKAQRRVQQRGKWGESTVLA